MKSKPSKNGKKIENKVVVLRNEKGYLLPGQVLNPTGMKKGTRHMATLLKEAIKNIANEEGMKVDKQIIRTVYQRAIRGDMKAIELVFDRVDGKPLQEIDLTSGGETIGMSPEQRSKLDELINQQ